MRRGSPTPRQQPDGVPPRRLWQQTDGVHRRPRQRTDGAHRRPRQQTEGVPQGVRQTERVYPRSSHPHGWEDNRNIIRVKRSHMTKRGYLEG